MVKKVLVLTVLAAVAIGGLGFAQWVCPPPVRWCPPAEEVERPPCYTAFWAGEEVHFRLVVPFRFFWCCCCNDKTMITGWRVETMDGMLVYQETFPEPRDPHCLEMVWGQKDMDGNQVAAGYYRLIVETTTDEYSTYIKIVEKADCRWFWGLWSWPCRVELCKPYVKVFRAPICPPVWPRACFPGCSITLYFGIGDP